jgi:uncharacterized protein GlcG (DUF336 family)
MALSTNHNNGASESQSRRTVTLSVGQAVLEAARAKATQIGVPMNIAVVDEGSNLVAFARNGRRVAGLDRHRAQNKAYTARAFDMPTKDLAPLAQPGGPLYGDRGQQPRAPDRGSHGGIPLISGGRVLGAIWCQRRLHRAGPGSGRGRRGRLLAAPVTEQVRPVPL